MRLHDFGSQHQCWIYREVRRFNPAVEMPNPRGRGAKNVPWTPAGRCRIRSLCMCTVFIEVQRTTKDAYTTGVAMTTAPTLALVFSGNIEEEKCPLQYFCTTLQDYVSGRQARSFAMSRQETYKSRLPAGAPYVVFTQATADDPVSEFQSCSSFRSVCPCS